jgi:hypothetical protein
VKTRVLLPALVALTASGPFSESRADVPDSRFGLVPMVGAGVAALTTPGSFLSTTTNQPVSMPGFIGYTSLGGEIIAQLQRWGLYGGFNFLSSGNAGRWTAYEGNLGVSYRLFGGSDSFSLFARGGLVYQHWVGEQIGGCSILFFVPNSCVTEGQNTASVNGDAIGVSGGVRLEMPLRNFYVAVGSTFTPVVTIDDWPTEENATLARSLSPGGVFQLRFDLEVGFRDSRSVHKPRHDQNEHRSSY